VSYLGGAGNWISARRRGSLYSSSGGLWALVTLVASDTSHGPESSIIEYIDHFFMGCYWAAENVGQVARRACLVINNNKKRMWAAYRVCLDCTWIEFA
jgi:hypothetical protein